MMTETEALLFKVKIPVHKFQGRIVIPETFREVLGNPSEMWASLVQAEDGKKRVILEPATPEQGDKPDQRRTRKGT